MKQDIKDTSKSQVIRHCECSEAICSLGRLLRSFLPRNDALEVFRNTLEFSIIFFLIILISSCRTGLISTQNLAYLYDKDMLMFTPEYTVFHKNDTVSVIYYKFNSGNILYVKSDDNGKFISKFSLKAELYESYNMKQILDSNAVTYYDDDRENKRDLIGSFEINTKIKGSALLKLIFTDINKHASLESYIDIYRITPYSEQNFTMLNADSLTFFKPWISDEQQFRILCNNKNVDKFIVRYYNRIFPVATPPYSTQSLATFNFKADSIFSVSVNNGYSGLINFPKKGIYHFQIDSSKKEGFTVLRFNEGFPNITTPSQMFFPLKYLTSRSEYEDLIVMKNRKEAVDKFWMLAAGNADRAKEMIKLYYNRIQDANEYFTSYLEGWKTDKGLIYIIYGSPNVVYRGQDMETWVYGEDRNMLSITFNFYKMENPFSNNDYSLSRSPLYKDGWFQAIENWRR
ncbi:MAG: GWxTD domain-containing protein [Bacteroidetes bacterium]|nr:GWxTD domain-containing protein [Bacteroidota bacterium]